VCCARAAQSPCAIVRTDSVVVSPVVSVDAAGVCLSASTTALDGTVTPWLLLSTAGHEPSSAISSTE
jgi:hypothetical protein